MQDLTIKISISTNRSARILNQCSESCQSSQTFPFLSAGFRGQKISDNLHDLINDQSLAVLLLRINGQQAINTCPNIGSIHAIYSSCFTYWLSRHRCRFENFSHNRGTDHKNQGFSGWGTNSCRAAWIFCTISSK